MSYYLIADPRTRLVVRRSRKMPPMHEAWTCALAVPAKTWKRYRAGDRVDAADLSGVYLDRWVDRTLAADRRRRATAPAPPRATDRP